MITNYLKTGYRNLLKNKTYSLLNILGLSVGIASAALIFLWVEDEVTYDHHHENLANLYRINENQTYDGVTLTFWATPGPLAHAMVAEIPGVKKAARMNWGQNLLFSRGEKSIYEQGNFADSSFFQLFDFPLIKGNRNNLFPQLHSVAISEKMAKKFFGNEDPLGKPLKVNNEHDYVITAVFADLPANSTFRFDWLAPFEIYFKDNQWLTNWGSNGIQTFVELESTADKRVIDKKLFSFIQARDKEAIARPFLFAMKDWRLYSNFVEGKQAGGRIEYVRLFTVIAWIILIIACINFMNLATARSEQRAREVGVRKVLGAGKSSLVGQFIGESLFMSLISVLFGLGILYLALPGFNALVQKELAIDISNPLHSIGLLAIGLVCGLIAGSYPALYLSSFNPITVFKGLRIQGMSSALVVRKGLVVLQFSLSIILIIGTIIIYQQIQHIKSRQLGYNKENLLLVNLTGKLEEHFNAIRQSLISTGAVENAALSNGQVLQFGNNGDGFTWQGKDPNKQILVTNNWVSPEFIRTLGMKLKIGRDFNANAATDSLSIIVNESFARVMGKENPVGDIVKFHDEDRRIVGVVSDFVYDDMYAKPGPLALFCTPERTNYMFIRLKQNDDLGASVAKVEKVVKAFNPGYPFEHRFVDQEFDNLFRSEMLIGQLSRLFAVLAIFISCLGLFGLAAYTAERRTKEIGIRRVLGASVAGIAGLLSKDFVRLIAFATLIAFPVAWWAMKNWLQDFAYRIEISSWVFIVAGIAALLIAIFTVSFQAIRAAIANPVKSLRSE